MRIRRLPRPLVLLLAAAITLPSGAGAAAPLELQTGPGAGPRIVAGRFAHEAAPDGRLARAGVLVVKFRRGAGPAARQSIHAAAGGVAVEPLRLRDTFRVKIGGGTLADGLAAYRRHQDVVDVAPDYLVRASDTPDDPRLGEQYGLERISAEDAWDVTHSSPTVKVAVLDCGIFNHLNPRLAGDNLPGHPDLRGKVVMQDDFSGSSSTDDVCDHGTHVAGIVAASTDNGVGVAGVGFEASLLNGKVLNDDGEGSDSTVADGIVWAAENGAKVINMSLGGAGQCSSVLRDAVEAALEAGAVIVAAAGNSGRRGAESPGNCPGVISVAATDEDDERAGFSNFGPTVHVAAPGVEILSTVRTGDYDTYNGTSMATPHVAGLAALVWSSPFGTSNEAVVNQIVGSADEIPGTGPRWAHGRVNAAAALNALTTATGLSFRGQPQSGDASVGERLGVPPQVRALDADGDRAGAFTGSVTLAIKPGTGSKGAALAGTTSLEAVGGIAVFGDLRVDRPGLGYVLVATASGLSAVESEPFNVLQPDDACKAPKKPGISARQDKGTLTVQFNGKPRIRPGCELLSVGWDFDVDAKGPLDTATQNPASHTYAAPGRYRVSFTATDDAGHARERVRKIKVK